MAPPDSDFDCAVVAHAAMFRLKAKRKNKINVLIKLIMNHLLYFIGSQDSISPRGVFVSN